MSETTERLDAITARLNAATAGPWYFTPNGYVHTESPAGHEDPEWFGYLAETIYHRDAAFVANAPTDVAYLLTLARKQAAALERVLEACDRIIDNADGHKPPGPPHPTREQGAAMRIRTALKEQP